MKSVRFPTPLHPFVTRDVLVETYEVRIRTYLAVPFTCSWAVSASLCLQNLVVLVCKDKSRERAIDYMCEDFGCDPRWAVA